MNDTIDRVNIDQNEEEILNYKVSDEALEAAATGSDMGPHATDGGRTYCWGECATKKYVCTTHESDCR
jgi:hypothetical protein